MNVKPEIFKAYDVRGVYPVDFNEEIAYAITQAYAKLLKPRSVVLAKDVRESGPQLWKAAKNGFCDAGVDVIDIGTTSTDMYYYAVATLPVDGGITISASHNPREWNGMNMCRKGAVPIALDSGLAEIRDELLRDAGGAPLKASRQGSVAAENIWDAYAKYLLSYIDPAKIRPMQVVANANCGMQTKILEHIVKVGNLPLTLIPLNSEPDGTFPIPEGHPNPLVPKNRGAFLDLVLKEKADIGVSWDADGDRCFFADETGYFVDGYFGTAMLAMIMLKRHPGATIVSDPRNVWAVQRTVQRYGGKIILSKPGMTVVPAKMRAVGAVFGGEMSAHYYFKDNWYRDNGILPFLLILEYLSKTQKSFSQVVQPFRDTYAYSGEVNFTVNNAKSILAKMEATYPEDHHQHIDGISVEYPNWRFNLRASNTEPLLRLNLEAKSKVLLEQKMEEVKKLIQGDA